MRGKIVVVIFVVAAIAFAAYGMWFIFSPSPVDQRFNMSRNPASSTIAQAALLPDSLDDFKRVGDVTNPTPETSQGRYINNAYVIDFSVGSAKGQSAATLLKQPACQGGSVISHTKNGGRTPFSYSTCQKSYIFQWINGDWLFTASAADPEALLRFVNLYGY
jgi:hypothetical protein